MRTWLTDTATTERFPLYTRGNADEVGPEPFPPLTWSLAWEKGAVPGVADGWVHLGGFRPDEFRWPVPEVFGCWGGYFYNQVSLGRVFSVRTPGGSPDAIDQAYFGANADIPPYEADPRDEDPELTAAVLQTVTEVLGAESVPYADAFVAKVRRWAAERPDLAALSDEELLRYGREACYRLRETWDVYARIVVSASIGPATVSAIAAGVGRGGDAVAVFTSLGGVETAGTAGRVWELSRTVRASTALSAAFDAGTDGLLERLEALPDGEAGPFLAGFRALLTDYGHRGPNEWDLAPDTWLTKPSLALAMVDRIRLQDDEHAPGTRAAAGVALREQVTAELEALVAGDPVTLATLQAGIRSGQLFYRTREEGKDAAVRVMLEAKLPFFELARRAHGRGALVRAEHVFQLLDEELDDFVADPARFTDLLAERAAQFASLADREPPYTVLHGRPVPPIEEWPLRARAGDDADRAQPGDTLAGTGVSPGVVTGRARVVSDLSEADDLEPGDVLVCATTDPSWVPLFMVAGGVVCEIGAQGSHAAIVSREMGVPCVVSVPDARRRIAPGSLLTLDGTTGTVTVG
jgi:phosphohistidine swiveling domain-containing protein